MKPAVSSSLACLFRAGRWLPVALLCALVLPAWAEEKSKSAEEKPARSDEHIWSALVLATQADKPKPLPPELAKIGPKIERAFGYNQLELIGSATKNIDEDYEHWLVPTQNFYLCVKSTRKPENCYMLDLSIFQDKKCLVQTMAKLGANSPLLIRGPMHARGQLVIVLQVQP